ncbi:MAG TPA: rhodanese-like domain-containing protein [Niabella sp.]|mgnify:CR=1 FL=1|nr:rhodanese-like domain-containing protein [Niabella sp.]HOZ96179.1 rhodanese-like domain-containing protein [Niabella sp.]HQW13544.1 rhodanese-like domain-containing protein [Niabella sp.]HQX18938.1 rhodanese-like domain-containing protein [Niabella sp.]HQX40443.1 rhodanese-like domain-containing protein [Niabella sp.]
MKELSVDTFQELASRLPVIDTRTAEIFKYGFVKGSIALSGFEKFRAFAPLYLSSDIITSRLEILLVCEDSEKESWAKEIGKSEFKVAGCLLGGFSSWEQAGKPIDIIVDVEPDELMMDIPFDDNLVVIDVRPAINFGNGHLKEAVSLPLNVLHDPLRMAAIEDYDNIYLVGNTDEEVIMAASVLKRQDIHNLRVVLGGWEAVVRQPMAKITKEPETLN